MQREGERKLDGERARRREEGRESKKEGGRERNCMRLCVCGHVFMFVYVCVYEQW